MDKMKAKHVIETLCNSLMMRPYSRIEGLGSQRYDRSIKTGLAGLYFRVTVDGENFGYDKKEKHHQAWERQYRRVIHIIVTEKHNVFVAVTELVGPEAKIPSFELWQNASNHDSCWNEALNVINEVAGDAYHDIWERDFIPEAERPAPIAAFINIEFSNWHFGYRPFQVVMVKAVWGDKDNYRFNLTEVTPLEFGLSVKLPQVGAANV